VDQGVAALWVMAHHFERPLSYIGYGGQGKQVRDFLHVSDLCDLILEQLENFGTWDGWLGNVAGGAENSASLCELTEMCRAITGRKIEIGSDPVNRPADLRIFMGDNSRLFARTSWRPKKSVSHIIQDIHRWVTENEAALSKIN
jgi:CDP-paratose 2-epimerase